MENNNYLFQFIKGNKQICPACGRKSFAAMVNVQTGEMTQFGKCDHLNSCGYKLIPTGEDVMAWRKQQSNLTCTKSAVSHLETPSKEVYSVPVEVANKIYQSCKDGGKDGGKNNLLTYFEEVARKLGVKVEEVECMLRQAWKEMRVTFSFNGSNKVIYWQQAIDGRIATGKVMRYDQEGHRIKYVNSPVGWVHSDDSFGCKIDPDKQQLRQCLFNEHLLAQYPAADVFVVESEKTAIILWIYLKMESRTRQFVILSTGGAGNFKLGMFEPILRALKGRNITTIPDHGMFDKWAQEAKQISTAADKLGIKANWFMVDVRNVRKKFNLSDKQIESLHKGFDIADVLVMH
ncbi:MAG: DUF6371 domain-containing protein [Bacteroidales bacterium]|jgi:hypothetical protein|nr:DUF6371 domain-containing protein [Bacteroidales bacterium]